MISLILFYLFILILLTCAVMCFILSYQTRDDVLSNSNIELFFIRLSNSSIITDYIYQVLLNFCKSENLPVFEVPDSVINKNISDPHEKASGIYEYFKNMTIHEQHLKSSELIKKMNSYNLLIDGDYNYERKEELDYIVPKILLNNDVSSFNSTKMFTLAHEIGHYLIDKNSEVQSEDAADKYIAILFNEKLPSIFSSIFSLSLKVYAKTEIHVENYKKEYKKYVKFIEENPELNFPRFENKSK